MLSISPLPFPKSWHDKTYLPFFLSSVVDQVFSINNCMPTWAGNQCEWRVTYPSWQLRTGIANHAKQIPERGTGICMRAFTFLIHTPNGSYNRALKNLCSLFHFCCSLSIAVHCINCVLELSNSSPLVFLQFYFIKVSFMQTTLLHNLCSITLLQLEARW